MALSTQAVSVRQNLSKSGSQKYLGIPKLLVTLNNVYTLPSLYSNLVLFPTDRAAGITCKYLVFSDPQAASL